MVTLYDDQTIEEIAKNETQIIRKKNSTFVVKKLRPTMIGSRKYDFFFMEETDENGEMKLTFIAKDDEKKIIAQEQLETENIAQNYDYKV